MSVSDHVRHQPRPKISSQVDGIAGFPTEAGAQSKDEEEQTEREPFIRLSHADIRVVLQREDNKHQDRARNELREELARFRYEGLWVRAEYTSRGSLRRWDGPYAMACVMIDRREIVRVNDARGAEGA